MNAPSKQIAADPVSQLEMALAGALPTLEGAKKNSDNPHFKSKYADLGSVIEAIRPVAEHGIWFRQVLHEGERGVTVETLYTGFGATISAGTLFMPADKANAQGYGSALTYARRYALQTAFGLSAEDDDGNAASAPRKTEARNEPPACVSEADLNKIISLCEAVGGNQSGLICNAYKIDALPELTPSQAKAVMGKLSDKLAQRAKSETNKEAQHA